MDRIRVWRTRGHILQRTSRKTTFLFPSVGCGFLTLCCVFIGSGQLAGVELESVSGGLSETDIGEIRDISAQHFIRFSEQNPETTTEKTVVIKNTTWVTEQVLTNHLGVCERLLAKLCGNARKDFGFYDENSLAPRSIREQVHGLYNYHRCTDFHQIKIMHEVRVFILICFMSWVTWELG